MIHHAGNVWNNPDFVCKDSDWPAKTSNILSRFITPIHRAAIGAKKDMRGHHHVIDNSIANKLQTADSFG